MSNKENNTEQPITDISIYIAALQKTYAPAPTPADATHFFSTAEVVDAIREIDPSAKSCANRGVLCSPQCRFRFLQSPWITRLEFKWSSVKNNFFTFQIKRQCAVKRAVPRPLNSLINQLSFAL